MNDKLKDNYWKKVDEFGGMREIMKAMYPERFKSSDNNSDAPKNEASDETNL